MSDDLAFDEAWLVEQLERLPRRGRVAFALACAERLYGPYGPYADRVWYGESGELSAVLERLWRECEAAEVATDWVESSAERLTRLIPHDDDVQWSVPGHTELNEFSTALYYALESYRLGDSEMPAHAAEHAYGVRWSTVANRHDIDLNAPGGVQAVARDSLVQAELARQRRDLEDLLRGPDSPELVRRLRGRAKDEAALLAEAQRDGPTKD